jgi:alpha-tubulin suppressor-like RCC1 family protein
MGFVRAVALVFVLCAQGCDVGAVPFVCAYDGQCVQEGVQGDCEANGWCSFPDPSCESGARYAEHASEELSEQCVPKCIAEIALGKAHGCLRKVDGTVWCWGENADEQTGPGETPLVPHRVDGVSDARGLALGDRHSCAIVGDAGTVWCWGANDAQQCGVSGTGPAAPVEVPLEGPVMSLALGAKHSCAALADDVAEVRCWGDNEDGQLGTIPGGMQSTPTTLSYRANALAVGGGTSCALATNRVECWGDNGCGQINYDDPDPVPFTSKMSVMDAFGAAVGKTFACVAVEERVTCSGSLKDDSTCTDPKRGNPIVGTDENQGPQQLTAGRSHACLLYRRGDVACWGAANASQLGPTVAADTEGLAIYQDGVPLAIQVAAGGDTSCALTQTGEVLCWGANDRGQLGREGPANEPHPVSWVSDAVSCP